jgi:hypothetical protein
MSPNSWFSQPVYIPGGNPETMNEASLLYPGQIGIRFNYINPPRTVVAADDSEDGRSKGFQLVHTDSSMSVNPYDGAVAWWNRQDLYRVTTSPTSLGRGRIAGVFRTAVTPGYYCCIQQKGPGTVKFIDAVTTPPTAAGLLVIPSATAAKADCLAAGSAATYPILGRSMGVYNAVEATGRVDLNVPDVL